MKLSERQRRHLRGLGHHLKPVVWIGQHGLTAPVLAEVEQALAAHELIKVKVAADRYARTAIGARLRDDTGAEMIHAIGQMVVLFRRNPTNPKVALPST